MDDTVERFLSESFQKVKMLKVLQNCQSVAQKSQKYPLLEENLLLWQNFSGSTANFG